MLSEGRRVHLSRTLVNTLNWHMLLSNDHDLCNVVLFIRHIVWTQHKLVCCHAYSSSSSIPKRNRKLHLIILFSPLSLSPPICLYNSSLLPSICCFHVSSKIFLPLTNFKYSLRVLSTIAYKHLEIIESLRAQWSCAVEVIKYGLEPTLFVDGLCIAIDLGVDTPKEYIIYALFLFSPDSWK